MPSTQQESNPWPQNFAPQACALPLCNNHYPIKQVSNADVLLNNFFETWMPTWAALNKTRWTKIELFWSQRNNYFSIVPNLENWFWVSTLTRKVSVTSLQIFWQQLEQLRLVAAKMFWKASSGTSWTRPQEWLLWFSFKASWETFSVLLNKRRTLFWRAEKI